MFNKEKFKQVAAEICQKGYATTSNHVVGVLTCDKPKGSRTNIFLKIINAGRYSRTLGFMSVTDDKIYYFPYKKEKPVYEKMYDIQPEMIINKDKISPAGTFSLKIKDGAGVIQSIYAVIGTIVTMEFVEGFFRIIEN